jgi:hypothetical protein
MDEEEHELMLEKLRVDKKVPRQSAPKSWADL